MPWEARDLLEPGLEPSPGIAAVQRDQPWYDWISRHADYSTTQEDLVPLPSGGVFAESVLGRANSAEKLDITRFWNWQDSPIPLQPPDIAALQSGSRAQADNTTPSGLAAPVVAFNNPRPPRRRSQPPRSRAPGKERPARARRPPRAQRPPPRRRSRWPSLRCPC
jgi:hypothetical protein